MTQHIVTIDSVTLFHPMCTNQRTVESRQRAKCSDVLVLQQNSVTNVSKNFTHKMAAETMAAGIDMERNYVQTNVLQSQRAAKI